MMGCGIVDMQSKKGSKKRIEAAVFTAPPGCYIYYVHI